MTAEWLRKLVPGPVVEKDGEATLFVPSERLSHVVETVRNRGYFLEDITATDVTEGLVLLYHFAHYDETGRITLRLLAGLDGPSAPSISSIYSGAAWHERECHDLFGIEFVSHPDLLPLLLAEDAGIHPLLKDEAARKPISELMPFLAETDGGME